jgi:hypothetical protein
MQSHRCQKAPQNHGGTEAPPTFSERNDPADCAPGFVWLVQAAAFPVLIFSVVPEAGWRDNLLSGSHHSDTSLRANSSRSSSD